jgi:hypothetical protein
MMGAHAFVWTEAITRENLIENSDPMQSSDLTIVLEYLAHQWLPIEVREAYQRILESQGRRAMERA